MAITVVLLVGAGWMVKSFRALQQTDLGFRPEHLLTFRVNLGWKAYDEVHETRGYFRQLLDRLDALPGVTGVATNRNLPLGGVVDRPTVTLEGQAADEQLRNPYVNRQVVSNGYFEMMGIELLAGRWFEDRDHPEAPPVAVVGQRAANALWPDGSAIGQRLKFGGPGSKRPWTEVVGIVGDVQHERIGGAPGLDVYVELFQNPDHNAFVVLRTEGEPENLSRLANEVALSVDPDQSTWEHVAMERRIADNLWRQRLTGALVSLFTLLAATLAAVGLYGVLSTVVRRRQREIGIRVALGARVAGILRAVLGRSLLQALSGAVLGLLAIPLLGMPVRSLLHGTRIFDPGVLAAAVAALVAVALIAGWAPAARAARVDPMTILREE